MKKSIETEINIHLYLRTDINKNVIERIKQLKSKRKLNKIIINLLNEYIENENQLELFSKEKQS